MSGASRRAAKEARTWAASLDPLDRELFVAYNEPRLRVLQGAARASDGAARAAARLQRKLDACRKVKRLKHRERRAMLPPAGLPCRLPGPDTSPRVSGLFRDEGGAIAFAPWLTEDDGTDTLVGGGCA